MANRRVWYGVHQAGIAKDGTNTFTSVHGLQSIGVNTRFQLTHIFEVGQGAKYESAEEVPDVEITMEKVLDGYPLIWHLMTQDAPSETLVGRSNEKATVGWSIYPDTNDSSSGTPLSQATMSGTFISSLDYKFQINGPCTESVTAVGNKKVWDNTFTATAFNNTDTPPATGGVQMKEDVLFGTGQSKLPTQIPGVDPTGYNLENGSLGCYGASVQSIGISVNLGREAMYELGRKIPYHRYAQFPTEVNTTIEIMGREDGDAIEALPDEDNALDNTIIIKMRSGTQFNLGTKNTLVSSNVTGANAGQNSANQTITYAFVNHNTLTITDPADPG